MTYTQIHERIVGTQFLLDLELRQGLKRQREIGEIPGMMSYAERAMLWSLLARTWRGDGAVIDGGSFFGSSLYAEVTGMQESPRLAGLDLSKFPNSKPIHGYERGYLPAPQNPEVDRNRVFGGQPYVMGESFLPILERTIEPYTSLIDMHVGDLTAEKWDGSPIEIAFIDVCKTIQLNAHVSEQFYPALIPGASTLINQDFFFDRLPWIKVTMGFLKDYFRWEGLVMSSSVYSNIKAVPEDVARYDPFKEATYEECLAYHDAVEFPGLPRVYAFRLGVSLAYLMALKKHKDEGLDYLNLIGGKFADILGEADNPAIGRGNQFRFERAFRQISNGSIQRFATGQWRRT